MSPIDPNQLRSASQWANHGWGAPLFGPHEIEKLVDRLSVALSSQSELVRELDTTHRQLEAHQAEIEAARLRAERATETLSTFLSALGHDLREPLVTASAGLEMLASDAATLTPETVAARADGLRRICRHGLALVDDLFELLRSDAGQWRVELRPVNLVELVNDACLIVAPRIAAKGLKFEVRWECPQIAASDGSSTSATREVTPRAAHAHPDTMHRDALNPVRTNPAQWGTLEHSTIETDPVRLRQALVNVLGNAVKFTERGSIVVRVAQCSVSMFSITVTDSGPGFDESDLLHVFEPFVQSARTSTRASEGVGLGLAIVERCVRLLGGTAHARNAQERGAAIEMIVPLRRMNSAPVWDNRLIGNAQPRKYCFRILAVDDAPDALRLLHHHLAAHGCEVEVAASLAEAREALTRRCFELMIVDGHLADGRGMDLAHALGAPPVVLSSAYCEDTHARQAHFLLPKPISREAVSAMLRDFAATRTD